MLARYCTYCFDTKDDEGSYVSVDEMAPEATAVVALIHHQLMMIALIHLQLMMNGTLV